MGKFNIPLSSRIRKRACRRIRVERTSSPAVQRFLVQRTQRSSHAHRHAIQEAPKLQLRLSSYVVKTHYSPFLQGKDAMRSNRRDSVLKIFRPYALSLQSFEDQSKEMILWDAMPFVPQLCEKGFVDLRGNLASEGDGLHHTHNLWQSHIEDAARRNR